MERGVESERAVGFIGLGRMGQAMVLRLLGAGFRVHVWNREPERLLPAIERGAIACASPFEVTSASSLVLSCLLDATAVEEVIFGDAGVAGASGTNKLFVDHASIHPEVTRAFANRLLSQNGMRWVDAPVSGSVTGVEHGTLAILCGGEAHDIDRVRPVFAAYGSRITRLGPVGSGQTAKLCNQIIVANAMCAIAEAVRLAEDAGLDAARLPEALAGGAADSMLLQLLVPRMITPPPDSLGAARTMLKDLDAVLDVAHSIETPLPMTTAAAAQFEMMVEQGRGEEDPSHLVNLFRKPLRIGK